MGKWSTQFSKELKIRWDEYVDCQKRIVREAPFLLSILGPYHGGRVLDAAIGLGCEARFLAKNGFNVIANEIDPILQENAQLKFASEKLAVLSTSVDWREIKKYFEAGSLDAVIIVGNSLSLLSDPEDHKLVVENVWHVLRPGGVFIVDQRNYDYYLVDREKIISGDFKYSGNIMYCERGIIGRPTVIENDRVRLTCFDKCDNRELGYFDVFPFVRDGLRRLLKGAGFSNITEYFDFKNVRPNNWDFKTYVCIK